MANKTANLFARIEPETKVSAESILEALGIPVSTAINMLYKQIILNNGLPFKAQLPSKKPLNLAEITEEQFNSEINKSYQSILRGEGTSCNSSVFKPVFRRLPPARPPSQKTTLLPRPLSHPSIPNKTVTSKKTVLFT